MKDFVRILLLLILFVLMVYQIQKWGNEEYKKDSILLKNDFVLKGTVDYIDFSNNHCFSVIHLKDFKCNIQVFNPKQGEKYFPYAVNYGDAEVYVNVCSTFIDSGDSVIVDSNKRTAFFKTKSSGNHQGDITFVQGEISFIRKKSKLFIENF